MELASVVQPRWQSSSQRGRTRRHLVTGASLETTSGWISPSKGLGWIEGRRPPFAGCWSKAQRTELDRGRVPLNNRIAVMVAVMMALSPRLRQQSRSSPWVWESSGRTAIESSSRESPTGERCCVFRVFVRELVPFECAESRTYDDARVVYLGIALAYIYTRV